MLSLWNWKKSTNNCKTDHKEPKWNSNLYCSKDKSNSGSCRKDHNIKNKNFNKKSQEWNKKFLTMKNIFNTSMKKKYNKKICKKSITCLKKNLENLKKETLNFNSLSVTSKSNMRTF